MRRVRAAMRKHADSPGCTEQNRMLRHGGSGIERWFAELAYKRIRSGLFRSVQDADAILASIARCTQPARTVV